MKKFLDYIWVEDYRRDMTPREKTYRDNKLALIMLAVLLFTVLALMPLQAEVSKHHKKVEMKNEWICPNKSCGYDNYDGIRYCGLCGTERSSRRR
jgi:hypothetical protein